MPETFPGHHSRTEILSQPHVWRAAISDLAGQAREGLPVLSDYQQVIFTGCGSTYYLSLWAAHELQQARGIPARAAPASELVFFPTAWLVPSARTLLVAVSRSGQTSETLWAVERFLSARTGDVVAITCYPDSPLAKMGKWSLTTPAAQEQSVAQTRSFTSMMLAALWLIQPEAGPGLAHGLGSACGRSLERTGGLAGTLAREPGLERFFFLGGGARYGLACEAMLKMKEMSLSHAEAFHFLEFRHGPISTVDEHSLVAGLLGGAGQEHEIAVLRDAQDAGAHVLVIADMAEEAIGPIADTVVTLDSGLPVPWQGPLFLPFLQLLAYERALAKGLDADRPANLQAVVVLHG